MIITELRDDIAETARALNAGIEATGGWFMRLLWLAFALTAVLVLLKGVVQLAGLMWGVLPF